MTAPADSEPRLRPLARFFSKTGRPSAEVDPEGRATRCAYYPADHPAAGRLAILVNADTKEQHLAYTPRGEQRGVRGDSVHPLLYDYNDYSERVALRTFQTTPEGDPSHVEDRSQGRCPGLVWIGPLALIKRGHPSRPP